MINILLEGYGIGAVWLHHELKKYIKPEHRACVVALSFRDSVVKNAEDWDSLYAVGGKHYDGIVNGLRAYGIKKDAISFINYYTDTSEVAKEKIKNADIVYFLGGLPDRMMDRIRELDLLDTLKAYDGIVMGYSAGALVQLSEYHLSPDKDYPEFKYDKGIGYIDSFYIEVHYNGEQIKKDSIIRVAKERKKRVYAVSLMSGAIIVDNGEIRLIGEVTERERI